METRKEVTGREQSQFSEGEDEITEGCGVERKLNGEEDADRTGGDHERAEKRGHGPSGHGDNQTEPKNNFSKTAT